MFTRMAANIYDFGEIRDLNKSNDRHLSRNQDTENKTSKVYCENSRDYEDVLEFCPDPGPHPSGNTSSQKNIETVTHVGMGVLHGIESVHGVKNLDPVGALIHGTESVHEFVEAYESNQESNKIKIWEQGVGRAATIKVKNPVPTQNTYNGNTQDNSSNGNDYSYDGRQSDNNHNDDRGFIDRSGMDRW